ncbi:protein cortex isoform X2 [Phlebotomus papatasi]|uniref:protein cortex isoform X2 n=1 Tax=Phlebotomus papatasi TaxID=29031 RepID=UPI002484490D|nr:protein cortex isoform X2 [Phlebotomus papatasi]
MGMHIKSTKIEKTSSFAPLGYGDRFIPRRYCERRTDDPDDIEVDDIFMNPLTCSWKNFNYSKIFKELFNIRNKKRASEWSDERILSFTDELHKRFTVELNTFWAPMFNYAVTPKWYTALDWACVPRTRSLAFMDTVHSIQGFHKSGKKKLIVWNQANEIVAFVRPEIVTWQPGSANLMVYSLNNITALAFDANGHYMAAGGKIGRRVFLDIWETKKKNIDLVSLVRMKDKTEIRCLAWSRSGSHIVCGQMSGTLTVHRASNLRSPCLVLLQHHVRPIIEIKFSANFLLFAVADQSGVVSVWNWVMKTLRFKLKSPIESYVYLDWHPWCSTEFVIASRTPASIGVVNTVEKNVVAWYKRCDKKCIIDAISFNKLSGELVVALRRRNQYNKTNTMILVLASLEHVSDIIYKKRMRKIFHLMWSPDGKILATAGSQNDLTLWNFFGKSDISLRKCTKKKEKKSIVKKESTFGHFPISTIR